MRIMAIDYGDARTGIAVSDLTGSIAGEAWTLEEKSLKNAAKIIAHAALTREVSRIVVGHPKNMNGTIGPRAEKSAFFADTLRSFCDIEVMLWDERMTTVSANRVLSEVGKRGAKRKKTVDAVAAAIILENYLCSVT